MYVMPLWVADNAVDPLAPLLQYGVLGIFVVILVLFGRTLIKREQDRADAEHTENLRLNQLIQEKTMPALISATEAIRASQSILQTMQYQRDLEQAAAAAALAQAQTTRPAPRRAPSRKPPPKG